MSEENAIVEVKPDYRLGVIPAKSPHDVVYQATQIAKELANIIKDKRLASNIQGKEYVRVEGWSTMGAMLGVLPRETAHQRFEDGSYEAEVDLIRLSDNAVIGHASARVGADEKTWGSRPEYARLSMAITRATGKAYRLGFSWIMALAGYEATPAEEMEAVVDGEYREAPQPASGGNGKHAERPLDSETLAEMLDKKSMQYRGKKASDAQRGLFAGMLSIIFQDDDKKRQTVQEFLFGASHTKDIPDEFILAGLDWLKPSKDSGGAYTPDPMAEKESHAVYTACLKIEGQQELI